MQKNKAQNFIFPRKITGSTRWGRARHSDWCENSFIMVVYQNYYRPQRSCGQGYVFTRVCDSVHGGFSGEPPHQDQVREPPVTRQTPPRPRRTPRDQGEPPPPWTRQTPPWDQGEPPWTRQTPPPAGRTPLGPDRPPKFEEDCSIRSMSGWYASYWNAFLFFLKFCLRARLKKFSHRQPL